MLLESFFLIPDGRAGLGVAALAGLRRAGPREEDAPSAARVDGGGASERILGSLPR